MGASLACPVPVVQRTSFKYNPLNKFGGGGCQVHSDFTDDLARHLEGQLIAHFCLGFSKRIRQFTARYYSVQTHFFC